MNTTSVWVKLNSVAAMVRNFWIFIGCDHHYTNQRVSDSILHEVIILIAQPMAFSFLTCILLTQDRIYQRCC